MKSFNDKVLKKCNFLGKFSYQKNIKTTTTTISVVVVSNVYLFRVIATLFLNVYTYLFVHGCISTVFKLSLMELSNLHI